MTDGATAAAAPSASTTAAPSRSIGLALSGGGWRAMLFHVGVVRALSKSGRLRDVKLITGVSGGAVTAAFVTLHWQKCVDPETVDETLSHLVALSRSDTRNWVIYKTLWGGWIRLPCWAIRLLPLPDGVRTVLLDVREALLPNSFLQRALRKLFDRKPLKALAQKDAPSIRILATPVNTEGLYWFSERGLTLDPSVPKQSNLSAGDIEIAEAVAASASFPGMFNPRRVRYKTHRWETSRTIQAKDCFLGDAGIYDNLGIEPFLRAGPDERVDALLISDAGARIDWADETRTAIVGPAIRSIDIVHSRCASLQLERCADLKILRADISAEDAGHDPSTTQIAGHARHVRTDLDRFSDTEIHYLTRHGYDVARVAFGLDAPALPADWPLGAQHMRRVGRPADLEDGSGTRIGVFPKPRALWGGLFAMPFAVAATVVLYGTGRIAAKSVEDRLAEVTNEFRAAEDRLTVFSFGDFKSASLDSATPVNSMDAIDVRAMTISSDTRVFDYRHQEAGGDVGVKCIVTRLIRAKRTREDASHVIIPGGTSDRVAGIELGPEHRPTVRHLVAKQADPPLSEGFYVDFDIDDVPVGGDFELLMRLTTASPTGASTVSAGVLILYPTENASLTVLWPAGQFEPMFASVVPKGEKQAQPVDAAAIRPDRARGLVDWDIREPASGFQYWLRTQRD